MKKLITFILLASVLWGQPGQTAFDPGYLDGAKLTWVNLTNLTVGVTNEVTRLRDKDNLWNITFTNALTLFLSGTGANRFDVTGQTNRPYNIYVATRRNKPYTNIILIASTNEISPQNGSLTNVSAGTNASGVYLPVYDSFRLVGSFKYEDVGAKFVLQSGSGRVRTTEIFASNRYMDVTVNTGTNTTFTHVSLSNQIPVKATAVKIKIGLVATTAAAGSVVLQDAAGLEAFPVSEYTMTAPGTNVTVTQYFYDWINVKDRSIQYKITGATLANLYVMGWREDL